MKERPLQSNFQKHSYIFWLFFLAPVLAYSQDTLRVIDEQSIPLPGVEVYTPDFRFTGITDDSGNVILINISADQEIQFRLLGYENLALKISDLRELGFILQLYPAESLIEEVLVLGRSERSQKSLPYQIQSITNEELQSTNSQTSADALAAHGDVFVQKSQMGGGSPVIRGFEANKVLLVVDGVRLNNAIYRNGHLQNAITIDQAMLEKIDVIYGPNSLIYGSDALGGVVHFRSYNPSLNLTGSGSLTKLNYALRYASANKENSAHLDFNLGGKKFASLTSISFSDFGDLRTGDSRSEVYPEFGKRTIYADTENGEDIIVSNENPNIQIGTAYRQFDVLQKFLFQPNNDWQMIGNLQYSTSNDVPRYDALIEPSGNGLQYAEWYYGPQDRFLASVTAKHFRENKMYDKSVFIASFQHINEDRINRRFGRKNRVSNLEEVSVFSFTADFEKKLHSNQKLFYGLDIQTNSVASVAFEEDIVSQQINDNVFTRYPSGGSDMTLGGIYAQYELSSKDKQRYFSTGVRYSFNDLFFSYKSSDPIQWPQRFYDGINSSNSAISWSLGFTQNYKNGWQWRTLVSTAFRSPNIDDMAKVRVKSDEITFPNDQLGPEKSINGELTLAKEIFRDKLHLGKFSITGFYTRLNDAIVRQDFTDIDGSPIFISNSDSLFITANQNAQKAYIAGISTNFFINIVQNLKLNGSLSWIKGRIIEEGIDNTPLSHIPPFYGKIGLSFEESKWKFEIVERFNGKKPVSEYGSSADNLEFATAEGALAWNTLNLYGTYKLDKKVQLSVSLENIFDKHYRPFASGVSGAGFNAIIGIRGTL